MREPAAVAASHLVSVRAASKRTGIPRRTLYYWAQHEKIWSAVIAGRIMLHDDDVRMLELRRAS